MTLLDAVTAAFVERAGRRPDGVWGAPGRVNLIGEHTDYNDGFVLPVAIDRSVVVAAARRADDGFRCWSTRGGAGGPVPPVRRPSDIGPGRSTGWSAYAEGMAWVLRDQGLAVPGVDLVVHADLPSGAGLSSSAALEAAVGLALTDLAGGAAGTGARSSPAAPLDRVALALAGQRAENDVVGMPCGIMDQMAVLLGRAGHALFLDTRSQHAELVPFDPAALGLTLLVLDTRVKHTLAGSPYAERRRACERAAEVLGVAALRDVTLTGLEAAAADGRLDAVTFRRARHVVTENDRVLQVVAALRAGDLEPVGPALAASHRSLRDDYEVSCAELDVAVESAVGAGAVAARMTGGGFGGSALALVPVAAADTVASAVADAFATNGFAPPSVFDVAVSDGATRLA
ncbi:MAG TPA: galactokinase [Acidimicrobiia bacterium]|nr:galactokinase [Acidimicrobiia bacterium]